MTDKFNRVFDFMLELDKLKSVLRKTKPLGSKRYENSAEHSWQVALFALLLAEHSTQPIDVLRVVEILLLHDVPEIDAGDRMVYHAKDAALAAAERAAAVRVFGLLPETLGARCLARWEEYEARETSEARFAYAIDRLMPVLQNLNNSGQAWVENEVPMEKILAVNAAIGDALPEVWAHFQSLLKAFAESGTVASLWSRPAGA